MCEEKWTQSLSRLQFSHGDEEVPPMGPGPGLPVSSCHAGLIKLEHVSLDGSKVKANALKHKAMSHGRMESEVERLEGEIQELLSRAEAIDAEEDARYGKGQDAHPISEELKCRERRLEAIRKAKAELEEEARHAKVDELRKRAERQRRAAETEEDPPERKRKLTRAERSEERADRLAGEDSKGADSAAPDGPDDDLPSHKVPTTREGSPTPKAQRNFTDPESRIMKLLTAPPASLAA